MGVRGMRAMVLVMLAAMPMELFACTEDAPPVGGDLPGDRGGGVGDATTTDEALDRDAGAADGAARSDADAALAQDG